MFFPAEGFGGPVTNTLELAKRLSKESKITICTSNAKNFSEEMNIDEKKLDENFIIKYFPITSRMFKQFVTPKMKSFLKNNLEKYDIVHLHCYRQYQDFIFWSINKKIKKPYYLTMHGAITPIGEKSYLKKIYDILVGKKILRNAEKIIVLSNLQKEEALSMGVHENKIIQIPFGINHDENKLETSNYDFDNSKKYILYLGRIDKSKGIDDLILAFKEISDKDIELLIVGPDFGFMNYCKELVKKLDLEKKIKFLGSVNHSNLPEIFNIVSLLVLPSKYDATGTVTVEAASLGVPIILTEKCGLAEEFKKNNGAKIVAASDIEGLKNAIEWIFDNPDEVKVMKENGQKYAKSLTWETTISKHLEVYQN